MILDSLPQTQSWMSSYRELFFKPGSMPKLPALRAAQVVRAPEDAGFHRVRQRGSHLQLRRGNLLVTVPMHRGDLRIGTLRSIVRQARLIVDEFLGLL